MTKSIEYQINKIIEKTILNKFMPTIENWTIDLYDYLLFNEDKYIAYQDSKGKRHYRNCFSEIIKALEKIVSIIAVSDDIDRLTSPSQFIREFDKIEFSDIDYSFENNYFYVHTRKYKRELHNKLIRRTKFEKIS